MARFEPGAVWFNKELISSLQETGGSISELIDPVITVIKGLPSEGTGAEFTVHRINLADLNLLAREAVVSRDMLESRYTFGGQHSDVSVPIDHAVDRMRKAARTMVRAEKGAAVHNMNTAVAEKIIKEFFPTIRTGTLDDEVYRKMASIADRVKVRGTWSEDLTKTFFGDFMDDLAHLHTADVGDVSFYTKQLLLDPRNAHRDTGLIGLVDRMATMGVNTARLESELSHMAVENQPTKTMQSLRRISNVINDQVSGRINSVRLAGRTEELPMIDALKIQQEQLRFLADRTPEGLNASELQLVNNKLRDVDRNIAMAYGKMRQPSITDEVYLGELSTLRKDAASLSHSVQDIVDSRLNRMSPSRAKVLDSLSHDVPEALRRVTKIAETLSMSDAQRRALEVADRAKVRMERIVEGDIVQYTRLREGDRIRQITGIYQGKGISELVPKDLTRMEVFAQGILSPSEQMIARQQALFQRVTGKTDVLKGLSALVYKSPGETANLWFRMGGTEARVSLDRVIFEKGRVEQGLRVLREAGIEDAPVRSKIMQGLGHILRMDERRGMIPSTLPPGAIHEIIGRTGVAPTYNIPRVGMEGVPAALTEGPRYRFIDTPLEMQRATRLLRLTGDPQLRRSVEAALQDAMVTGNLGMLTGETAMDLAVMREQQKIKVLGGRIIKDGDSGVVRAILNKGNLSVVLAGEAQMVEEVKAGEMLFGLLRKQRQPDVYAKPPIGRDSPYYAGMKYLTRRAKYRKGVAVLNEEILRGSDKSALAMRSSIYKIHKLPAPGDALGIGALTAVWERPIDRKYGVPARVIEGYRHLDRNILERIFGMTDAKEIEKDFRTIFKAADIRTWKKEWGEEIAQIALADYKKETVVKNLLDTVDTLDHQRASDFVETIMKARQNLAKKTSMGVAAKRAGAFLGKMGGVVIGNTSSVDEIAKRVSNIVDAKFKGESVVKPLALDRWFDVSSEQNIQDMMNRINLAGADLRSKMREPHPPYFLNPSAKVARKVARDEAKALYDLNVTDLPRALGHTSWAEMQEHMIGKGRKLRGITPEMKLTAVRPETSKSLGWLEGLEGKRMFRKLHGKGMEALYSIEAIHKFTWQGREYGIPLTNYRLREEASRVLREDMADVPFLRNIEKEGRADLLRWYENTVNKGASPRRAFSHIVGKLAKEGVIGPTEFAYIAPDSPFRGMSDSVLTRAAQQAQDLRVQLLDGADIKLLHGKEWSEARAKTQFTGAMRHLHRAYAQELTTGRPSGVSPFLRLVREPVDLGRAGSVMVPFGRYAGRRIDEVAAGTLAYLQKTARKQPYWAGFVKAIDDYVIKEHKGGTIKVGTETTGTIDAPDHISAVKAGAEESRIGGKIVKEKPVRRVLEKGAIWRGLMKRPILAGALILGGSYLASKAMKDPLQEPRDESQLWKARIWQDTNLQNRMDYQQTLQPQTVEVDWAQNEMVNRKLALEISGNVPAGVDTQQIMDQMYVELDGMLPFEMMEQQRIQNGDHDNWVVENHDYGKVLTQVNQGAPMNRASISGI